MAAADPAFSYTLSGFVNTETTSVVSGSSQLLDHSHEIEPRRDLPDHVHDGDRLSVANYTFTFVKGTPRR